ncbi:MAG: hypothetical protein KGZ58_05975 [Ignavibacteriales bacterium]|nr:hypothetical protein [Ignavibacteriales bacterium]
MSRQTYRQYILDGIEGLPSDALAEVMDFIFFVRKRLQQTSTFEEELNQLLRTELKQLSRNEEIHLEKEFENFDKLYPRE